MTTTSYETDIAAWANEQAQLVRTGRFCMKCSSLHDS